VPPFADAKLMSLPAKLFRRGELGALLLVLTLIGTALAPTLLNGFTYDDLVTVEDNLFIRDWGNLKKFFRRTTTSTPRSILTGPWSP